MSILKRHGYGSNFNKISIDYINNILLKEITNEYGLWKLTKEINFYNFIINNNIKLKIPKIYEIGINFIKMEYMKDYLPIVDIISKFNVSNLDIILSKIYTELNILHNSKSLIILKEEYYDNLYYETHTKIELRLKHINHIINKYSNILFINGTKLIPLDILLYEIDKYIINYSDSINKFELVPIHGDCQFNNILYNKKLNNIVFIDPRGYYGHYDIYGIKEYDLAKIKYALSGCDIFDNKNITSLNIENNNINIEIEMFDKNIFNYKNEYEKFILVLMITIWLGNAEGYKNQEEKLITSHFIARYFGTILFN
jgi:hypothetical protein